MTRNELIKILIANGFISRGGTNHEKFVHPDGRATLVWRHKKDIALGTLKAISKQTGIKLP